MRVKKIGYMSTAILLVALLLALGACGDDDGEEVTTTALETATTAALTTETSLDGTATTEEGAGGTDGQEVFANTCAVCHGQEGEGDSGPNLQTRTDLTKDRVVEQVTNGGGAMPAYSPRLSEDEIDAVADYVIEDIVQ